MSNTKVTSWVTSELFTYWVEQYTPGVRSAISRIIHTPELVEDLTQETFLRAWQARDRVEDRSRVLAWLCTIARHIAIDCTRKRAFHELSLEALLEWEGEEGGSSPFPANALREMRQASEDLQTYIADRDLVARVFAHMEEREQTLLVLYYVEQHNNRELGARLGVKPRCAISRLCRARKHARKIGEQYFPEEMLPEQAAAQ